MKVSGDLANAILDTWPVRADEVASGLHPIIAIDAGAPGEPVAVGASKIGGAPDLPRDVAWPTDDYGDPLAFVAQIDLAACGPLDGRRVLPRAGHLHVFCSADEPELQSREPDAHIMLVDAGAGPLARTPLPPDLDDEEALFEERPLAFRRAVQVIEDEVADDVIDELDELVEEHVREVSAALLGRPTELCEVLAFHFDDEADELLLELSGDLVHRTGDDESVYTGGVFFVAIDRDELTRGDARTAQLVFRPAP